MGTKKTKDPETVATQIETLDEAKLLKMDVGKFCLLRDAADAKGRTRLDYLLEQARIKHLIRAVVQEELKKYPGPVWMLEKNSKQV